MSMYDRIRKWLAEDIRGERWVFRSKRYGIVQYWDSTLIGPGKFAFVIRGINDNRHLGGRYVYLPHPSSAVHQERFESEVRDVLASLKNEILTNEDREEKYQRSRVVGESINDSVDRVAKDLFGGPGSG